MTIGDIIVRLVYEVPPIVFTILAILCIVLLVMILAVKDKFKRSTVLDVLIFVVGIGCIWLGILGTAIQRNSPSLGAQGLVVTDAGKIIKLGAASKAAVKLLVDGDASIDGPVDVHFEPYMN